MNRQQAFRIAITALEFKRARYRVDADLAEQYGADYPTAINAKKQIDEINQAISFLQKEIEAHNHYSRQVIQ
jgi:hypothetical protein